MFKYDCFFYFQKSEPEEKDDKELVHHVCLWLNCSHIVHVCSKWLGSEWNVHVKINIITHHQPPPQPHCNLLTRPPTKTAILEGAGITTHNSSSPIHPHQLQYFHHKSWNSKFFNSITNIPIFLSQMLVIFLFYILNTAACWLWVVLLYPFPFSCLT